ncbi:Plasma membrane fusion protein [Spathaspora sp. JA1]|nr:Plasma membrane fusion protein [Spathaspora sp. JA1]
MNTPTHRNYLNLKEILSQSYLNKYTILFLLILIKLIILRNSLINHLSQTIASEDVCNKDQIEPILLSIHNVILEGLTQVQYASITFMIIIIKVIKNLILFFIELFLGTFICLLNAVIKGTTDLAFDSTETIIRAVNVTVVEVTNQVEEGLQGLSGVLNDFAKGAMGFKSIFSGKSSDPGEFEDKIHISLGQLKDKIAIPGDVIDKINSVRNSEVGKFTQLENTTQVILASPFEIISKQLKEIKDRKTFSGDIQPIDSDKIERLCSAHVENIQNAQAGLVKLVEKLSKWLIILLIIAMIGSTCYVAFMEWLKWKRMQEFANEDLTSFAKLKNQYNVYHSSSLYMILKRFHIPISDRMIWWWSYLTSEFAGYVLLFGMMGLIAVLLQYILISKLRQAIQERATSLLQDEQSKKITQAYIKDMKQYIKDTEHNVNKELFGNFQKATGTIHKELSGFIDHMNTTMNEIFGKTPLSKPINTVIYCVIGRKLIGLDNGITWLHDHVKVSLPRLSKELEDNITQLKFIKTDSVLNKFDSIVDVYEKSLRLELYISCVLVALWGLQIIIGSIWVFLQDRKVNEEQRLIISEPKQLTMSEKEEYGFPIDDPAVLMFPDSFINPRSTSFSNSPPEYRKS